MTPYCSMPMLARLSAYLGVAAIVAVVAPAQDAPKLEGLVLHYSFDLADPAQGLVDQSGHNNQGKPLGARATTQGKRGAGCEFASSTDRVEVVHSESLALKQATFAVWFKTTKLDFAWALLLDQGIEHGFAFGISGDAMTPGARGKLAATVDGAAVCIGDTIVADGAWHHAAATFDGKSLRLYLDGSPHKSVELPDAKLAPNPRALALGKIRPDQASPAASRSFEGALDEVMIFNRALSPDEIRTIVAVVDPTAGKPKFTKQQVVGRLRQLRLLHEEGLLTDDFYNRKVAECEAALP